MSFICIQYERAVRVTNITIIERVMFIWIDFQLFAVRVTNSTIIEREKFIWIKFQLFLDLLNCSGSLVK